MKKILPRTLITICLIFLYLPIIVLIVFSFNSSKSGMNWSGFSFRWYTALFRDNTIMNALKNTILIAVISSTLSTFIGMISSWGIVYLKPKARSTILKINDIPLINPDLVTGISLMTLFIFLKMKFGYATLLLAHLSFSIPFVVITILPQLKVITASQMEAAMDLGATPFNGFRRIILPQMREAILTSWLIAFTLSVDDFVISFFTTGSGVNNVSIVVYSMAKRGINPKINALSSILLGTILLSLFFINTKKTIKKENYNIEKEILLHDFGSDSNESAEPVLFE